MINPLFSLIKRIKEIIVFIYKTGSKVPQPVYNWGVFFLIIIAIIFNMF
jgi:hypothetical protein